MKSRQQEFEENVTWLRGNVPPDDIYEFAEQAVMAAEVFLDELNELIDLEEACEEDENLKSWVNNIYGLRMLKQQNYMGGLNVSISFNE